MILFDIMALNRNEIMFSDVQLENEMVRRRLNLKIPRIRLGHGLDYVRLRLLGSYQFFVFNLMKV